MDYFIRGPLILRAREIQEELKKGIAKPFNEIIKMNIGDAQAMGQIPITYIRQILSLVVYPQLLKTSHFPEDMKIRAQEILNSCSGNTTGAYTDSAGLEIIRKHVATYIKNRDLIPCDWNNIYLSSGASSGIRNVLRLFTDFESDKKPGVLYPLPQYPLYPVTLEDFNMYKMGYFLEESNNWGLDINYLDNLYEEKKIICNPKVLVVINPGNPTGQVLSRENIKAIIKFAYKKNLFIIADEVYQQNVYPCNIEFQSFKKVLTEMGKPYTDMQLASFMSCSKGFMSECGLRGGYVEILNLTAEMKTKLGRTMSSTLCPTIMGQIGVYCLTNPPRRGEPSYELYIEEKVKIVNNLNIKAKMTTVAFNNVEGFSCNEVQGAMYAFPSIKLPQKAIEAAKSHGYSPDEFYAFKLLENTGICVLPGVAFGQKEGTYHFRSTILPDIETIKRMITLMKKFNRDFFAEYK